VDSAIEEISRGVEGRNVYCGLATRRDSRNGKKENLRASGVLWVDVDFYEEEDSEVFAVALESFPLPPSLRVSSGGGEHLYWILEEPYFFSSTRATERFEHVLKGLCDTLGGDRAATDASRVLRVPGTMNYPDAKKRAVGRVPSPCQVISHDGRLYQWEDFVDFEARGRALATHSGPGAEYERQPWTGELPDRVRLVLCDEKLRARFERDASGLLDRSDSAIDFSLASLLAHRGLEGWEIEVAVRTSRVKAGGRDKGDDYFQRTVGKALAEAATIRKRHLEPVNRSAPDSGFLVPTPIPGTRNQNLEPATDSRPRLRLISAADLLAEPEEVERWQVDGLIPVGGSAVMAGKPKAGKSTVARALAVAAARGLTWLGRKTRKGAVAYLALEERRAEVCRHFRQLGLTAGDPVHVVFAPVPEDVLPLLLEAAREIKPVLIIVDTMQRLLRVRDLNDYAEVTTAFEPLLGLARETDASVLLLHHANKDGTDFDSILGSTAILGSVDTGLLLERTPDARLLSSRQRVGEDLPPTIIELEAETGFPRAVGTREERELKAKAEEIVSYLRDHPLAEEKEIQEATEGSKAIKVRALRKAVEVGVVERSGRGKKGDPFRYCLRSPRGTNSGSPVPDVGEGTKKPENQNPPTRETHPENVSSPPADQDPQRRNGTEDGSQDCPWEHDYDRWSSADWDSWYRHAARLEEKGGSPAAAAVKAFALVAEERKARSSGA
jgi:hypothetical protein